MAAGAAILLGAGVAVLVVPGTSHRTGTADGVGSQAHHDGTTRADGAAGGSPAADPAGSTVPAFAAGAPSRTAHDGGSGNALVPVAAPPPVPSGAVATGDLPSSTTVHVEIALEPRDPSALDAFVQAVSDPSSVQYRHYLAKGEFAARFGPTSATVDAVGNSLTAAGLRVGAVTADGLFLPASGTAAQVAAALHTKLEQFTLGSDRMAYADVSAPELPSRIAADVVGVTGLSDLVSPEPLVTPGPATPGAGATPGAEAPTAAASGNVTPGPPGAGMTGTAPRACATAATVAQRSGSYTWTQLASTYGFTTAYGAGDLGAGVTVGLFELARYPSADIQTFAQCFGITPSVTDVPVTGGAGARTQGADEALLDIEDVLGLAPKATVLVYSAANTTATATQHLLAEYRTMVTTDRAQVISTSWGECELEQPASTAAAENLIFEQAAAQGQSVFAATDDSGSTACRSSGAPTSATPAGTATRLAVDDPSSQPYVTGVGGTDLTSAVATSPHETVWNTGDGGGGGGVSTWWRMPAWQLTGRPAADVPRPTAPGAMCAPTPAGVPSAISCRQVPDVSASADPRNGDVIYCAGASTFTGCSRWSILGGTSAAAPLWAALTAVTDEGCGTRLGFVNPLIYQLGTADPTAFHDVTTGTDDVTGGHPGAFGAGPGYDNASGWGTPDGAAFFTAACQAQVATASVTLSTSQVHASGVTYTLTFTTSSFGPLAAGDPLTVLAPAGTSYGAGGDITMTSSGAGPVTSVAATPAAASVPSDAMLLTFGATLPASTPVVLRITTVTNATTAGQHSLTVGDTLAAAPFTLTPGAPSSAGSSVSAPATAPVGHAVTVTVTDADQYANPEIAHAVTLTAAPASPVAISQPSATTSASGVVTFNVTDQTPGSVTLTAADATSGVDLGQATIDFVRAGYREVSAGGAVFTFGTATSLGSAASFHLQAPVVGMAATPTGGGYWLVSADGGVFSFGTAPFLGSMGGKPLVQPVVGMAATPTGGGYWLVSADGGVFSFGTAPFLGSMGGKPLVQPVVGMAATPTGGGYWLVSADGGVFSFGTAPFLGSMGGKPLVQPVVGMAATPTGGGYWLVSADGGVFSFGTAPFLGSMGGKPLVQPVVGMAATPTGGGYWLVSADGKITPFGDAVFDGSLTSSAVNDPIVAMTGS